MSVPATDAVKPLRWCLYYRMETGAPRIDASILLHQLVDACLLAHNRTPEVDEALRVKNNSHTEEEECISYPMPTIMMQQLKEGEVGVWVETSRHLYGWLQESDTKAQLPSWLKERKIVEMGANPRKEREAIMGLMLGIFGFALPALVTLFITEVMKIRVSAISSSLFYVCCLGLSMWVYLEEEKRYVGLHLLDKPSKDHDDDADDQLFFHRRWARGIHRVYWRRDKQQ
jgi:hypothetical protein